jgi:hypothetical protein
MALATLKEEAKANAFSNLEDDEEELVVTEQALMDLINELRSVGQSPWHITTRTCFKLRVHMV